jgi:hypothetical protein
LFAELSNDDELERCKTTASDCRVQQAEIQWDYSFSDLFPRRNSMISGSGLPAAFASYVAQIVDFRCRAANAASRASREIARRDSDEISQLTASADDLAYRVERLQSNLRQTSRDMSVSLGASTRPTFGVKW